MTRALATALLCSSLIAAPALAADSPGVWQNQRLEGISQAIWDVKNPDDIIKTISQLPDNTGSRALNQLVKALLLAPVSIPDAQDDLEPLTAMRLQKLLEMGGLNEAKTLTNLIDTEEPLGPVLMDQVLLALVASNTKEAACLDLLAYQSDTPDQFARLSDGAKTVLQDCLKKKPADASPKKDYSFAELKDLGPWESALAIAGDAFSIKAEGNVAADFGALTPFQQALIMHSAAISPRLQWRLMGDVLRHDYITLSQAQDIYMRADLPNNMSATDVRKMVSSKSGFERLPFYYKSLSSDKSGDPALVKGLATPIAAAGVTYDLYALLPFQTYLGQLDMKTLSTRSAFINTMGIYLDGGTLADLNQRPEPKDAAWIFTALSGEQSYNGADLDIWAEQNLDLLSGIAPELRAKLAKRFEGTLNQNKNKSTFFLDYVNKKSLTDSANYVMHDDKALSQAESFGSDGAVGPMLVQLALAGKNTNPDRLDPEGMMRINRLLEKSGLTQTAHRLLVETLVFRMAPKTLSNGEQQ